VVAVLGWRSYLQVGRGVVMLGLEPIILWGYINSGEDHL
jgi:hypothetical protein